MAKDLPPKENALFKRILKCYENKQYKNGLKHARQILSNSKFQEHGETLAMMGLTLNCLGRKVEAYDNVKKGLRNNLTSHVCWHVFGLLQRSDKKYEEAIKCYRNALRWDKDNLQILRDLSLLQIQTRDLDGYKNTRRQLLMLRANQRAGWIGYAISLHVMGDHEDALNVLQTFRKTQEGKPVDYEFSELLLYEAAIMAEGGRTESALAHIYKHREAIVDVESWLAMAGDLHLKLGQMREAGLIFERLVARNPENKEYIAHYIKAQQPETEGEALEVCMRLHESYPRSEALTVCTLNLSRGEGFRSFVDGYMQRQLRKGVPPLFNILKHQFQDSEKMAIISDLVHGYCTSLEGSRKFHSDSELEELPTSYLHVLIFLAQLYDYKRDIQEALDYIDRALAHTPTYIDPYLVKSKIYKHAGNMTEAVHWLEEARTLDLADRYLNCKCAKYQLRAGMVTRAEELCALFTREGQNAVDNLNEMQCMWFLTESASAYAGKQDWAGALQKCHEIEKHFVDIVEDQFDFHPYSMRKMTLRAYIGLLKLEDTLRGHEFYNKAAKVAINTYLHLHDNPEGKSNGHRNGQSDELTDKEKKKLESKMKRAAKKQQSRHSTATTTAGTGGAGQGTGAKDQKKVANEGELLPPPIVGSDLVKTETPLEEVMRFLDPIRTLSPHWPDTHTLAFEVFYRKGKILLMIQSIKRAIRTNPETPEIPLHLTMLSDYVSRHPVENELVREIVDSEMEGLVPGGKMGEWLDRYSADHGNGLQQTFTVGCARAFLDAECSGKQLASVLSFDFKTTDLMSCLYVLERLQRGALSATPEHISTFKKQAHQSFPLCPSFRPDKDIQR